MVAEELPIATVGHWLRLPSVDLPRLRTLIHRQTAAQELLPSPGELAAADTATVELRAYVTALITQRRAAPGGDPVSAWLATWDRSGAARPAADEAVHYLTLLILLAAVETTTSLLSTVALLLARYPHQRAQLASHPDPEQVAAGVEEVLRYDPPTSPS
jgi:cytochrome P450